MKKENLKNIPFKRLPLVIKELGLKPYSSAQIIQWLYKKNVSSFDQMTNLSQEARRLLSERLYIGKLELVKTIESNDGTKKFAWKLEDGNIIESVLIPSEPYSKVPPSRLSNLSTHTLTHLRTRLTLCISTQVGCAMGCTFCRTAGMGFVRNLTLGEIVGQILETERTCLPLPSTSKGRAGERGTRISNVVLMGMGEPLANYDNVIEAIKIMTDTKGLGLSRRHVTLSTSGVIPGIEKLAKDDPGIKLAISLNATTDEQREKIMPINKKYPLAKLFEALKKYSLATKRSRITFEYVMINDFNDTNEDAKRLVKFLSYFPSKVNLIPLNDTCRDYKAPAEPTIQRFAQYLRNKHIQVNIRESRGQDILAACGQLAGSASN